MNFCHQNLNFFRYFRRFVLVSSNTGTVHLFALNLIDKEKEKINQFKTQKVHLHSKNISYYHLEVNGVSLN